MSEYFNEETWSQILLKPDWHLFINQELNQINQKAEKRGEKELIRAKQKVRDFIEEKLDQGQIYLGKTGINRDRWRKPIDTVVIHHTNRTPGYTWQRLSAVQLLNLYVPVFATDPVKRGEPIYSHHFREGKQVFYAYHWLVRMDGSVERLLEDHQIGWHSGVWEVNCRSIGICLDNDYTDSSPAKPVIKAMAGLIKDNYPKMDSRRVFGHREINPKIICPGNKFLSEWKNDLIFYLGS